MSDYLVERIVKRFGPDDDMRTIKQKIDVVEDAPDDWDLEQVIRQAYQQINEEPRLRFDHEISRIEQTISFEAIEE